MEESKTITRLESKKRTEKDHKAEETEAIEAVTMCWETSEGSLVEEPNKETDNQETKEVDNLHGIYPLKDEWVFGCSLKTRLADQTKTQQLKWLWSKESMNSTINQRLVEQTQEMNFKLEGSGGSTLDDTLR